VQQGGIEYARRLLRKSVSGEDADRIVRSVEQALHSAPFSFASKTESQNLLTFVQDEQPQTIALILSHLSGAQAAEVLKGLPRGKQLEVVRRMASMETTNPEVIHEVEASLEKRMASVVTQKFEPSGGVERVAEVLNLTDRATERDILDGLAQENPELVEEIRKRMFVFEDILLVDDKGVQQVLKEIDAQELSLSLKTASDEVKEKFFRNMSERAVRLVLEEMEYMGPVRLGQVDAGQQRIAEVCGGWRRTGKCRCADAQARRKSLSRIIKNFEGSRQSRESRTFDMAELGEAAREIVASAKEAAELIVAEARVEAERLKAEAYAVGLEKGKSAVRGELEHELAQEIRKAASRETAGLAATLGTVIAAVHESREALVRDSKEQLIALAIDIARSVVKREVRCASDVAKLNLEEAIRLSARRSKLLIHVNEMDMNMLETVLDGQPLLEEHQSTVEFVPSNQVRQGGCFVETASGSVDGRIETQLDEIEKVLLGEDRNG
jgi:flagellar motor switch protein FliG